jgi:hypothetical protein
LDHHLVSIIQAAEQGLECPPLRVLTGGLVIWGVPGSSKRFLEISEIFLTEQYESFLRQQPRRERKREYVDPEAQAREDMNNVRWPHSSTNEDFDAVTLLDAYVWPVAGGDGMELPTLRLPVENIAAWWIAGGRPVQAPKDKGSTWFVGGLFPMPIGN